MDYSFIDSILELKKRCPIIDTIGKSLELNERELEALSLVGRRGELSSKELSRQMELSPSRGSRVINRMVEEGYFASEPASDDRRYHRISLTAKGREGYGLLLKEKESCEELILARLDAGERLKVQEGLKILVELFIKDRVGGSDE